MEEISYEIVMEKVAQIIESADIHALSDSMRNPVRERIAYGGSTGGLSKIHVEYEVSFGIHVGLAVDLELAFTADYPHVRPSVTVSTPGCNRSIAEATAMAVLLSKVTDLAVLIDRFLARQKIAHPAIEKMKGKKKS